METTQKNWPLFSLMVLSFLLPATAAHAGEIIPLKAFQKPKSCKSILAGTLAADRSAKLIKLDGLSGPELNSSEAILTDESATLIATKESRSSMRLYHKDLHRNGSDPSLSEISLLDTSSDQGFSIRALRGRESLVNPVDSKLEIFNSQGQLLDRISLRSSLITQAKFLPGTHLVAMVLPSRKDIAIYDLDQKKWTLELNLPEGTVRPLKFQFSQNQRQMMILWQAKSGGYKQMISLLDPQRLVSLSQGPRFLPVTPPLIPDINSVELPNVQTEKTTLVDVGTRKQIRGNGEFSEASLNQSEKEYTQFQVLGDGSFLAFAAGGRAVVRFSALGELLNFTPLAKFIHVPLALTASTDGNLCLYGNQRVERYPDPNEGMVENSLALQMVAASGERLGELDFEPTVKPLLGPTTRHRQIRLRNLFVTPSPVRLAGEAPVYYLKFMIEVSTFDTGHLLQMETLWKFSVASNAPELIWHSDARAGVVPVFPGEAGPAF